MVARARTTRITHLFSEKTTKETPDEYQATSQKYSKGNVAIFAQDVASLRSILPPPREEIHEALCTLFVGASTVPTRENIKQLAPVVVSKSQVEQMIHFLLTKNAFYTGAGITYSPTNLADLFDQSEGDVGIPNAVELCCLPDETLNVDSFADRGDRGTHDTGNAKGEIIMEAVGYTVGEKSPKALRSMKASAVAWCLDKNNFVKMQSGSKFVSDRDTGLLTFAFPNLDPWGIGGFHEPNRSDTQRVSFEQQVKNLLLQSDGEFQRDPNFAYKAEVNRHVTFRTNAHSQSAIVSDIQEMGPLLTDLMKKWELNPNAKPSNKAEKKAIRTLGRLKLLAKDLKGSSGYKQCRRNEIRALMKKMATPALPSSWCNRRHRPGGMGGYDRI
ncbi:hypothetical protein C8R44DRAFT_827591 [Mycena epipterygia]|nr:hypothetical protein C8R44DRAFT_827591 [Mycena epipterygia]